MPPNHINSDRGYKKSFCSTSAALVMAPKHLSLARKKASWVLAFYKHIDRY